MEKIQKLPESKPINDTDGNHILQKYPSYYILSYWINNFKIYVNNKDFFMSKLPLLPDITTSYRKGTWDDDEIYYKIIFSIYCATYCCGTSIQHLTPKEDIHPIITSLMHFHVYFTIRRILRRLDGNEKISHISAEFSAGEIYRNGDHIRRRIIYNDRKKNQRNISLGDS